MRSIHETLLASTPDAGDLASFVPVNVSNVGDYLFQGGGAERIGDYESLPAAPPWEAFVLEWRSSDVKGVVAAAYVTGFHAKNSSRATPVVTPPGVTREVGREMIERHLAKAHTQWAERIDPLGLPEWVLHCALFASANTRSGQPHYMGSVDIALDRAGCMRLIGVSPSRTARTMGLDDANGVATVYASVILTSLAFMNCKNVEVRPRHLPRKVKRARERKGRPVVEFHHIEIDPMRRVLRDEGSAEKTGITRAFHLCRGHFRTYTPDRPLFGKVTGTFWVPMHVKGNKAVGRIEKDYSVKGVTTTEEVAMNEEKT